MLHLIAVVKFPTHSVRVEQHDDGHITCWKTSKSLCDYEEFDPGDLYSVADYILEPFSQFHYGIEWED